MNEIDRELLKELKDQAETLRNYLASSIGAAAFFLWIAGASVAQALGPELTLVAGLAFCAVIITIAAALLLKHAAINSLTKDIARSNRRYLESHEEERLAINEEGELVELPTKRKRRL